MPQTTMTWPAPLILIAILLLFIVIWRLRPSRMWTTVYAWEHGLSYVNGQFSGELPPGRYLSARPFQHRDIITLRRNDQIHQTGVVDVTSRDKFVFRLAAQFIYRIIDPRVAHEDSHIPKLELSVRSALLKVVAERSLESLIGDRDDAIKAILAVLPAPVSGCEINSVIITTITLPPELRRLFVEVERAKLEGLATLERARGEHAALRSLANAASLLKDNPSLMNLRLLQSVEAASSKGSITLVVGQDGVPVIGGAPARN